MASLFVTGIIAGHERLPSASFGLEGSGRLGGHVRWYTLSGDVGLYVDIMEKVVFR